MSDKNSKSNKKVAAGATVGVLALAAAGFGGAGLYALFTDTQQSSPATFQSGTVKLQVHDGSPVSYKDSVNNLAAGDTTYRFLNFENAGTLDLGRLEAKVATDGPLSTKGNTAAVQQTQVNGDTAVGTGNTPLQIKLTACVDGQWTWDSTTTNGVQGGLKNAPVCSGEAVEVMPQNTDDTNLTGALKSSDGVENFVDTSYFAGDTKASTVDALGGQHVTLFDVKEETADNGADASATPGKDGVANVAPNATLSWQPNKQLDYMITYHLPKTAKNEYQNTNANIKFIFTATQRDSQTVRGDAVVQGP